MQEKINWIMDDSNIEKINEIRLNGYNLVRKQDTWLNRLEKFKSYF